MLVSGTCSTCVGFGCGPYVAYCWFETGAAMMSIREIMAVGPAIILVSEPFCGIGIVWVECLLVLLLLPTLTRVMWRLMWRFMTSTILLWATSVSALCASTFCSSSASSPSLLVWLWLVWLLKMLLRRLLLKRWLVFLLWGRLGIILLWLCHVWWYWCYGCIFRIYRRCMLYWHVVH